MIPVVLMIAALALLVFALWWLLIETEGVYLGRRVVVWLYDVYASRYDKAVQRDEIAEHIYLAQPLVRRARRNHPLVLDVATGTGRIPLALCQHASFEGQIVGVDLSRKMLSRAVENIASEHFEDYVTFIWANAETLPFPDASFDVVTCMEALEFIPQPEEALKELTRVLRPGGLLLTTRRLNIYMPGKLWSEDEMTQLLQQNGIEKIEFEAWQVDYSKVWGRKSGKSEFIGAGEIPLRCPQCDSPMIEKNGAWECIGCEGRAPTAPDGVIELFPLQ